MLGPRRTQKAIAAATSAKTTAAGASPVPLASTTIAAKAMTPAQPVSRRLSQRPVAPGGRGRMLAVVVPLVSIGKV
jgi:phosphate-selective porin